MGFKYFHSEILNKAGKINTDTGAITIEDRTPSGKLVTYSAEEVQILKKNGGEIDPVIHNVKKIFEGVLI